MPVIRVNCDDAGLVLHREAGSADAALARAARESAGPVIVMVHGFSFRPGYGAHCPHEHILSMEDGPSWKAKSWPRGLGFGSGMADEGLGLALGWEARGTIWDAYRRAAIAGRALARAVRIIRAATPGREVHAIGHSLGARVVMRAMAQLEPGTVRRAILLNPAEFRGAAEAALARGAGPGAEVIAVTGRENAGFDMMLERLVGPVRRGRLRPGDRVLGRAPLDGPGQVTLRLDRSEVVARLAALGHPLGEKRPAVCHWSPYLRRGALPLYAALMRQPEAIALDKLRVAAPRAASEVAPVTWRPLLALLPMGRNAPS
ncbi:alpha/beta hydrolase [Aquicoccus porphyridii]|uniref:Alpha/beta hydrolase n=1 Tax=Aquicoccus porphyridii TaxID=1852029 RepID=A0A5A9Z4I2_9RHOB|nr:alpha/beta fold hydrolase [Aquicoccus porphyridii]KAA0912103.1 alpha/beta hydrolase [Aquicoccus porphyridii]RAI53042.1 hypothetical protein DOO74_14225 [Rhodobacteraceae bacterium AsT-22]